MKNKKRSNNHANDLYDIGTIAKSLGTGRNRFFEFLREKNVLDPWSHPYQKYVERGLLKLQEQKFKAGNALKLRYKPMLTASGVEYVKKLWQAEGDIQGELYFG